TELPTITEPSNDAATACEKASPGICGSSVAPLVVVQRYALPRGSLTLSVVGSCVKPRWALKSATFPSPDTPAAVNGKLLGKLVMTLTPPPAVQRKTCAPRFPTTTLASADIPVASSQLSSTTGRRVSTWPV